MRYKYHLSFIWTIFLGGWVNWGSHRWQWGECECAIDTHGRQLSIGVNHWLQYISGVIPDNLLHIYIYWSLSLCINLYQLSSNYSPLFTNHSKYIQVFFLSSILHMQCTSWLWYSYIVIILYSWPVPGVLGYYNSCILNNLPFTSLLLHVFFLGGGVFHHCNTQIHGLFYLHLINHVRCGIWISQSYVSYSLSVTSCPHIIYNYGSVPFYIGISNLHIQAYNTTILSFTEFTLIRHSTHGWKGFCST